MCTAVHGLKVADYKLKSSTGCKSHFHVLATEVAQIVSAACYLFKKRLDFAFNFHLDHNASKYFGWYQNNTFYLLIDFTLLHTLLDYIPPTFS